MLLALGLLLPYVTVAYLDDAMQLVQTTVRVGGAANLFGGIEPTNLPSFSETRIAQINTGFNVLAAAPGLQEVASVVALLTCWGLVVEEINKVLWWVLHLSAYPLIVVPVPLFAGLHLVREAGAAVTLAPGWTPAPVAGVLLLVFTLRARHRIDTYGGF